MNINSIIASNDHWELTTEFLISKSDPSNKISVSSLQGCNAGLVSRMLSFTSLEIKSLEEFSSFCQIYDQALEHLNFKPTSATVFADAFRRSVSDYLLKQSILIDPDSEIKISKNPVRIVRKHDCKDHFMKINENNSNEK